MYDCIIPAAGESSRMRGLEGPGQAAGPGGEAGSGTKGAPALKPILPFGKATLVEAAVGAALLAGCRVLLVLGHRAAEVAAPFASEAYRLARETGGLSLVNNPLWEEGLLGSIQRALPLVRGEAFFLTLADLPFIRPEDYRALATAREPSPNRTRPRGDRDACAAEAGGPPVVSAIFGSHEGRRGHPVLLPSAWIPEILALDRCGMMRDFLKDRPAGLVETGPGALRDIDTPGEYMAAMEVP
jgi:molybdenum cofactor cytidylyltransferase